MTNDAESGDWALSYSAGTHVALVAAGAALIFAGTPTGDQVARCWPLVHARVGVAEIIGALIGSGLPALPGFALVCADGAGVSVVVRAPGLAVVTERAGRTQLIDAAGLGTWSERRLAVDVARVTLSFETDTEERAEPSDLGPPDLVAPAGDPVGYPLVGGTVLAGSVTIARADLPDLPDLSDPGANAVAPAFEPDRAAAEPVVDPVIPVSAEPEPAAHPELPPIHEPATESAFAVSEPTPGVPEPAPPSPEPAPPSPSPGATVQSVACPYGHLGPPYEPYCRICGTAIEDPRPFLAERPPLGLLRLSTGDVIPLDRGVIMGRNPRPSDEPDPARPQPAQPHLIRLPSPDNDVSRTHVEVRLEDWHVLVVDLGSTNGTTVTIPGQPAVRLRAHEPMPLEPNAEVNLADEIVFRFEVPTR